MGHGGSPSNLLRGLFPEADCKSVVIHIPGGDERFNSSSPHYSERINMAFSTLENRLKTSVNQAGTPCVSAGVKEGLLYVIIQLGNYATPKALETAMIGYLGKEHKACDWVKLIKKAGE